MTRIGRIDTDSLVPSASAWGVRVTLRVGKGMAGESGYLPTGAPTSKTTAPALIVVAIVVCPESLGGVCQRCRGQIVCVGLAPFVADIDGRGMSIARL